MKQLVLIAVQYIVVSILFFIPSFPANQRQTTGENARKVVVAQLRYNPPVRARSRRVIVSSSRRGQHMFASNSHVLGRKTPKL